MDVDLYNEPLATDPEGNPVFLKEIWPSQQEIAHAVRDFLSTEQYLRVYDDIYNGENNWNSLAADRSQFFSWQDSSYIASPPYFEGMGKTVEEITDIQDARVLAHLGDSVTTDHISPAGAIAPDSPAGLYLQNQGVTPADFQFLRVSAG